MIFFQKEGGNTSSRARKERMIRVGVGAAVLLVVIIVIVVAVVTTSKSTEMKTDDGTKKTGGSMAVASDNDVCTKIGAEILKDGGSAVDATIATLLCLGAVQPQSNGIGGGGFMLVHTKTEDKVINFRERAPAAATKEMFVGNANLAQTGGLATAVPGEIMGYWTAHQMYGKLEWKDLFTPTIKILRSGIEVTAHMEMCLDRLKEVVIQDKNFESMFFNTAGDVESYKRAGEIFTNAKMADAYEKISEEGTDAFYKGSVAQNIVDATEARGGILTLADLENYEVTIDEPFKFEYRGQKIISAPPPASGHVIALALQILDEFEISTFSPLKAWNYIIEAMRFGYAMRSRTGDPLFSEQTEEVVQSVQDKTYKEKLIRDHFTDKDPIHPFKLIGKYTSPFYANEDGHRTTHVSVLGPDGEAVACTSTVNLWFGARVMTDDGIVMNNEMDDFSSPDITNAFGYQPSPENFIVPNKRPLSSSSPSIVFNSDGEATFVTGAAGGSRIISSTLQSLINALDWKMPLDENLKTARVHDQLQNGETWYEVLDYITPIDPSALDGLRYLEYNMTAKEGVTSVVTSVSKLLEETEAAGDPRKQGTGIVI